MKINGGTEFEPHPVPIQNLQERVTRLETRMEYLATKEDISKVLLALEKQRSDLITWTIVTGVSVLGVGFAYLRWVESLSG